jgi:probable F420-dependent oxidoreductase
MKTGISLPVREMQDDLTAIRDFAQGAEELGFSHLRVPDQVIRTDSGYVHEPLTLMAYIAAITTRIELVPSIIVLPSRQTALLAKQAAEIDILSGGRLRLGVGVGSSQEEFAAMGMDFHSRGARCDEQLALLKMLWTRESVHFSGRWDHVDGAGLAPLPVQRPIPVWIGARALPSNPVIRRIGQFADGWFVLCGPDEYAGLRERIDSAAGAAGRKGSAIGAEAGVAVVGPREHEWLDRVSGWRSTGLTHVCLRTLGGNLNSSEHLQKMQQIAAMIEL